MSNETIGFAVICRWKLKQGLEKQFIKSWSTATQMLMKLRGSPGLRIHKAEEESFPPILLTPIADYLDGKPSASSD